MNIKSIIIEFLLVLVLFACSSNDEDLLPTPTYPNYGDEINVTIIGLPYDAMEPFISADGQYLFFNNKNDGINTKLFYASKVNDSTFNFLGELAGTNQIIPPHLDAVPDMDINGTFYWTSTRNYPTELNNLFQGTFNLGAVNNIKRVKGDFNMNIPGWLTMDHGISLDGQLLYFNNARFDENNCQGPCETIMGIAQKVDLNTFNTISDSDLILQNINDSNYIYYAPCISGDHLEFYYTRYKKGNITTNTIFEICVALRNNSEDAFSVPKVLFSESIVNLIEAPSLTTDKEIMYYHKKIADTHKIMMRYRFSN